MNEWKEGEKEAIEEEFSGLFSRFVDLKETLESHSALTRNLEAQAAQAPRPDLLAEIERRTKQAEAWKNEFGL
jgi:hypothetical protein